MVRIGTKESPFIAAASRAGALPGFLFASPVGAGITCALMIVVTGIVFGMFFVMTVGIGDLGLIYEGVVFWGTLCMGGSAFVLAIIAIGSLHGEDGADRLRFASSALSMLVIIAALWALSHPWLSAKALAFGSIA